jgi:very-short-patch-repair endonuclease
MFCPCGNQHNNIKYCSRKCQLHYIRIGKRSERVKINCLFCKKEFEVTKNRLEKFKRKYCSRNCKDQHTKILYLGEGNPLWNKKISNEARQKHSESSIKLWKLPEFRDKFKIGIEKYIKAHGYYPGSDKLSREKRKNTCLEKYGVDHDWKDKNVYQKCNKTCLSKYGKTSQQIAREKIVKEDTELEKIIEKKLIELQVKFVKQYRLYFDSYSYRKFDFYLPQHNLLIEVDGDYWHGNPKFYNKFNEIQIYTKENDKFKNELVKTSNISLLRIWGSDIIGENFNLKVLIDEKVQSKI